VSATETQLIILETEYFVTRVLYSVELLYSISKRKFVRPIQLDYPKVQYRLYPGVYVSFWGWWESGRDHVSIRVAPVKVKQGRGTQGEMEKIYEKWTFVRYKKLGFQLIRP